MQSLLGSYTVPLVAVSLSYPNTQQLCMGRLLPRKSHHRSHPGRQTNYYGTGGRMGTSRNDGQTSLSQHGSQRLLDGPAMHFSKRRVYPTNTSQHRHYLPNPSRRRSVAWTPLPLSSSRAGRNGTCLPTRPGRHVHAEIHRGPWHARLL